MVRVFAEWLENHLLKYRNVQQNVTTQYVNDVIKIGAMFHMAHPGLFLSVHLISGRTMGIVNI